MKHEIPILWGWRCVGGHQHPTGEECPDDYIHDPERALIFTSKVFDSAEDVEAWVEAGRPA